MKNFLCVVVTVAMGYLIWDALQTPPPPPAPVVAVAKPALPAPPKLYFHSSLDAPAMPTSSHTAMGYYSTDSTSGYNGGYANSGNGLGSTYAAGGSTVLGGPTGQFASSSVVAQAPVSGVAAGTAQANQNMANQARAARDAAAARSGATISGQTLSTTPARTW